MKDLPDDNEKNSDLITEQNEIDEEADRIYREYLEYKRKREEEE